MAGRFEYDIALLSYASQTYCVKVAVSEGRAPIRIVTFRDCPNARRRGKGVRVPGGLKGGKEGSVDFRLLADHTRRAPLRIRDSTSVPRIFSLAPPPPPHPTPPRSPCSERRGVLVLVSCPLFSYFLPPFSFLLSPCPLSQSLLVPPPPWVAPPCPPLLALPWFFLRGTRGTGAVSGLRGTYLQEGNLSPGMSGTAITPAVPPPTAAALPL